MLLLSWNVAGWNTTVNRICEHYSNNTTDNNKNNNGNPTAMTTTATKQQQPSLSSSPIAAYFARHGNPMIICLQEHKIPYSQLTSRSEPRQAATVPGYESFWSCCVDPQRKGLNGTVTYCRTGTVRRADAAPLRDAALDRQGRCVMTDHGRFVVFNVYVPNSGGHPMALKMKFLQALRRAMQRQRTQHDKAVILVGDLNIAHRAKDMFWNDRIVHIQDILDQVEAARAATAASTTAKSKAQLLPAWKRDIARHWTTIERILETRQVVQTKTTNSLTKETYNKYRLCVTIDNNDNHNMNDTKDKTNCSSSGIRKVFLGKHESCEDYAAYGYDYHEAYYVDEETGERVITREHRTISVGRLAELMLKLVNVEWSEQVQREIATTEATEPRISPKRQWLTSLLEEDGMVDAFRHFYPHAEGRYTCWCQFTNRRYVNDGARIDYTLIDKSLLPFLQKGDGLRCGLPPANREKEEQEESSATTQDDCCSETMALRAATAGGRFQPVSFQGGGITEVSPQTLDTQFGPPHTGMVYTPPSYSDHIGVSLLLDDAVLASDKKSSNDDHVAATAALTLQSDAATRKAQPHKVQRTLASFFGPSSNNDNSSSPSSMANKTTAPPSKLQRTVIPSTSADKKKKNFFGASSLSSNEGTSKSSTSGNNKETAANKRPLVSKSVPKSKKKAVGKTTPKTPSILQHFQKQTK